MKKFKLPASRRSSQPVLSSLPEDLPTMETKKKKKGLFSFLFHHGKKKEKSGKDQLARTDKTDDVTENASKYEAPCFATEYGDSREKRAGKDRRCSMSSLAIEPLPTSTDPDDKEEENKLESGAMSHLQNWPEGGDRESADSPEEQNLDDRVITPSVVEINPEIYDEEERNSSPSSRSSGFEEEAYSVTEPGKDQSSSGLNPPVEIGENPTLGNTADELAVDEFEGFSLPSLDISWNPDTELSSAGSIAGMAKGSLTCGRTSMNDSPLMEADNELDMKDASLLTPPGDAEMNQETGFERRFQQTDALRQIVCARNKNRKRKTRELRKLSDASCSSTGQPESTAAMSAKMRKTFTGDNVEDATGAPPRDEMKLRLTGRENGDATRTVNGTKEVTTKGSGLMRVIQSSEKHNAGECGEDILDELRNGMEANGKPDPDDIRKSIGYFIEVVDPEGSTTDETEERCLSDSQSTIADAATGSTGWKMMRCVKPDVISDLGDLESKFTDSLPCRKNKRHFNVKNTRRSHSELTGMFKVENQMPTIVGRSHIQSQIMSPEKVNLFQPAPTHLSTLSKSIPANEINEVGDMFNPVHVNSSGVCADESSRFAGGENCYTLGIKSRRPRHNSELTLKDLERALEINTLKSWLTLYCAVQNTTKPNKDLNISNPDPIGPQIISDIQSINKASTVRWSALEPSTGMEPTHPSNKPAGHQEYVTTIQIRGNRSSRIVTEVKSGDDARCSHIEPRNEMDLEKDISVVRVSVEDDWKTDNFGNCFDAGKTRNTTESYVFPSKNAGKFSPVSDTPTQSVVPAGNYGEPVNSPETKVIYVSVVNSGSVRNVVKVVPAEKAAGRYRQMEMDSAIDGDRYANQARTRDSRTIANSMAAYDNQKSRNLDQIFDRPSQRSTNRGQRFVQPGQRFTDLNHRFVDRDQGYTNCSRNFAKSGQGFIDLDPRSVDRNQRSTNRSETPAECDCKFADQDQRFVDRDQGSTNRSKTPAECDSKFADQDQRFVDRDQIRRHRRKRTVEPRRKMTDLDQTYADRDQTHQCRGGAELGHEYDDLGRPSRDRDQRYSYSDQISTERDRRFANQGASYPDQRTVSFDRRSSNFDQRSTNACHRSNSRVDPKSEDVCPLSDYLYREERFVDQQPISNDIIKIPDEQIPYDRIPDDWIPDDWIPDDRIPDDRIPDDRIPDNHIPDDWISDDWIPNDRIPDEQIPDDRIPDDRISDDHIPDDWIPDDRIPDDRKNSHSNRAIEIRDQRSKHQIQMSNDQIRKLNDRDQLSKESDPKPNFRNNQRSSNQDYSSSDRENISKDPDDISSDRDYISSDGNHFSDDENQRQNRKNNIVMMRAQASTEQHSGSEDQNLSDENAESEDQTQRLNLLIHSKELENSDNHGKVEVEFSQYENDTNLSDVENEASSNEVMVRADLIGSSDSSQMDENSDPGRNCTRLSNDSAILGNKQRVGHQFTDTSDTINTKETWLPPDPEVIIASKDTAQTRSEVTECMARNEQEIGIITEKTSNMGIDKLDKKETSLTLESEILGTEILGTEEPDLRFYFGIKTTKQEQDRLDRLYSKLFESIGIDLEEGAVTDEDGGVEIESEENSQINNSSAKTILHNDWNKETIAETESSWNAEIIPVSQKSWNGEVISVSDDYWIDDNDFYRNTDKNLTSVTGTAELDSESNAMLEHIQEYSYPYQTHGDNIPNPEMEMIREPEIESSDEHICSDSNTDQFQSDMQLERKPKYLPPYSKISHSKNLSASNSESESKPESKLNSKPDSKPEPKPELYPETKYNSNTEPCTTDPISPAKRRLFPKLNRSLSEDQNTGLRKSSPGGNKQKKSMQEQLSDLQQRFSGWRSRLEESSILGKEEGKDQFGFADPRSDSTDDNNNSIFDEVDFFEPSEIVPRFQRRRRQRSVRRVSDPQTADSDLYPEGESNSKRSIFSKNFGTNSRNLLARSNSVSSIWNPVPIPRVAMARFNADGTPKSILKRYPNSGQKNSVADITSGLGRSDEAKISGYSTTVKTDPEMDQDEHREGTAGESDVSESRNLDELTTSFFSDPPPYNSSMDYRNSLLDSRIDPTSSSPICEPPKFVGSHHSRSSWRSNSDLGLGSVSWKGNK